MSKALKTVEELQENIYKTENYENYFVGYTTAGYGEAINLIVLHNGIRAEINIWNSEDDYREYIEEKDDYEELTPYIKRRLKELITSLGTLNKIL